jgi:hypothetical protein
MTEPETNTFVAPCEGGPLDGRLWCMDRSAESFALPATVNGVHVFAAVKYRKLRKRDGSIVWKYDET